MPFPVNSPFNLPHYFTSYMHYAQVKMRVKKRCYKKKKIGYEKFASRRFEPGPSKPVRTKS